MALVSHPRVREEDVVHVRRRNQVVELEDVEKHVAKELATWSHVSQVCKHITHVV